MFEFKTLTLSSGHPIVTPTGKPITQQEFREYFRIASDWLKEIRPESFEEIKPSADNEKTYGSMLNKMFEAYGYDPIKGGVVERYFLYERTLAFIFVASYYIQKEDRTDTNPFLHHVLGNALLEWLPIPELVEHHLSLSARSGDIRDGVTLSEVFGSGLRYRRWGFPHDKSKALKYAKMAYESPFSKRDGRPLYVDLVYAKALFESSKKNAAKCMEIVFEKLRWFHKPYDDDYLLNAASFLALGLEISSKVRLPRDLRIDLTLVEETIERTWIGWASANECSYWLAMCYIAGKNNPKDASKAIKLLTTRIRNPDLAKLAAAALSQMYLDGNGVEKDPSQAYSIARFAAVQRGSLKGHRDQGEIALKRIFKRSSEQLTNK